jgi:hypothetical protein
MLFGDDQPTLLEYSTMLQHKDTATLGCRCEN